jgi:hypothetical protein
MLADDYTIRYAVSAVSEGLQLLADAVPDPDPDRRTDLIAAYQTLPLAEQQALMMRAWGFTDLAIAKAALGRDDDSKAGARLHARAFSNLRATMNGKDSGR